MPRSRDSRVGQVVLDFALHGQFPEEADFHLPLLAPSATPDGNDTTNVAAVHQALDMVRAAKQKVQEEMAARADASQTVLAEWSARVQQIHQDVAESKRLATEMVLLHQRTTTTTTGSDEHHHWASMPSTSADDLAPAAAKVEFLQRETIYSTQLGSILGQIRDIRRDLQTLEQKLAVVESGDKVESGGETRSKVRSEDSTDRREGSTHDTHVLSIRDALQSVRRLRRDLDAVPLPSSSRVLRLLSGQLHEARAAIHDRVRRQWQETVCLRMDEGDGWSVARPQMAMEAWKESAVWPDLLEGLAYFGEVDERAEQTWHLVDSTFCQTRLDPLQDCRFRVAGPTLSLVDSIDYATTNAEEGEEEEEEQALAGVTSSAAVATLQLLYDLQKWFLFWAERLPPPLWTKVYGRMVVGVVPRLVHEWLSTTVPSSLDSTTTSTDGQTLTETPASTTTPTDRPNMHDYDIVRQRARSLLAVLSTTSPSASVTDSPRPASVTDAMSELASASAAVDALRDWVSDAPRVWLETCRATALDAVRRHFHDVGLGDGRVVERVEREMVSREEGNALVQPGRMMMAQADPDDWDAAWAEDPEPGPEDLGQAVPEQQQADDDAWGWDDQSDQDDQTDGQNGLKEEGLKDTKGGGRSVGLDTQLEPAAGHDKLDDAEDAWGWGEEDVGDDDEILDPDVDSLSTAQKTRSTQKVETQNPQSVSQSIAPSSHGPTPQDIIPKTPTAADGTREMVLREAYRISSVPDALLRLVRQVLADARCLYTDTPTPVLDTTTTTRSQRKDPEHGSSSVVSAREDLFTVVRQCLALYRAVAPFHYGREGPRGGGGNMLLYNDASFLADQLVALLAEYRSVDAADPVHETASEWTTSVVRTVEGEMASLRSFANRAYLNEMATQRTVVDDLLGGAYNLWQQEDAGLSVDHAVDHVRAVALRQWQGVAPRSVWCQAVGGTLVEAVAAKLIADVLDMSSIGQDEAYTIARLMARVTAALEPLFALSVLEQMDKPASAATTDVKLDTREDVKPDRDRDDDTHQDVHHDSASLIAQYVPSWLRMQFLGEVLQSNLSEIRYLWFESELSLYFSADEVVDLLHMSFQDNARRREVIRAIAG